MWGLFSGAIQQQQQLRNRFGKRMKKEKKKEVTHAPPRPANRRLVTTCFWWFCPRTQQIRNRSCVYHRWYLLPVLWTSAGLEHLEFSNCIRPGCILKPPSDSLETGMACADMFTELKTGSDRETISNQISCMTQITAGRRTKYNWHRLCLSWAVLRDPKLDWFIKGSQSSPLHLCARKVH